MPPSPVKVIRVLVLLPDGARTGFTTGKSALQENCRWSSFLAEADALDWRRKVKRKPAMRSGAALPVALISVLSGKMTTPGPDSILRAGAA